MCRLSVQSVSKKQVTHSTSDLFICNELPLISSMFYEETNCTLLCPTKQKTTKAICLPNMVYIKSFRPVTYCRTTNRIYNWYNQIPYIPKCSDLIDENQVLV